MRKSSPAWSFLGKIKDSNKVDVKPGPGAYNPKESETSPRWGTSKSPRMPKERSLSPGPAAYSIIENSPSKKCV